MYVELEEVVLMCFDGVVVFVFVFFASIYFHSWTKTNKAFRFLGPGLQDIAD